MDQNSTLSLHVTDCRSDKKEPVIASASAEPAETTIRNILDYSRSLEVKRTSSAGNVDLVLN